MTRLSRRRFVALAAGAATPLTVAATAAAETGASRAAGQTALTAQTIVDRIQREIGVPWQVGMRDGLMAGMLSSPVTGIVTTSMATLTVLQQAVDAGATLVITAAPAVYGRAGGQPANAIDSVWYDKQAFIARHRLVVVRLGHHWQQRTPDPRAVGLAALMDWGAPRVGRDGLICEVPRQSLETLARELTARLGIRGSLRAIGSRTLEVRRVGLLPGVSRIEAAIALLPAVDALVAGEVWEWETAAYVQDVVYAGRSKGFVSIGRVVNEAPGMRLCADWLRSLVPEVPVRFIDAGDPYWRPA